MIAELSILTALLSALPLPALLVRNGRLHFFNTEFETLTGHDPADAHLSGVVANADRFRFTRTAPSRSHEVGIAFHTPEGGLVFLDLLFCRIALPSGALVIAIGLACPEHARRQKLRELSCGVMRSALDAWERGTGKGRCELARESGQWRVHVNPDGWERTQTLDRYLEPESVPENPRWRHVLCTGRHVLDAISPHEQWGGLASDLEKLEWLGRRGT